MNMVTRNKTTMAKYIMMKMVSKSNKMIQMRNMDKRTMDRMTTKLITDFIHLNLKFFNEHKANRNT